MNKNQIRQQLLQIRKDIPQVIRDVKNEEITRRLEELDVFKKAQHILFYYSFNNEVDTHFLIKKYLDKKQLYLPQIQSETFKAVPIKTPLKLRTGKQGVMEPIDFDPNSSFENEIDLVITPGVAFDKNGNRIGMGKGYYDRYFAINNSPVKVALAYEEQVLDSVPKDTYDVAVDLIVTNKKIHYYH